MSSATLRKCPCCFRLVSVMCNRDVCHSCHTLNLCHGNTPQLGPASVEEAEEELNEFRKRYQKFKLVAGKK